MSQLRRLVAPPQNTGGVDLWTIAQIVDARNQQLFGSFALPARLAISMRTDDALFTARTVRLAPVQALEPEIIEAKGARAKPIAKEAEAAFGVEGVGIECGTMADINGDLADHGVAIGYNTPSAFFRAHPDYDAVGGPQLNLTDEGPLGRATGHALGSPFGSLRSYKRYRRAKASLEATQLDLTSANLFLRRKAFDKWGPFDERLWPNEETALLHKIEKGGGKIAYDPSIVVAHKRRSSIVALARQCFGYGKGRARQTNLEGGVLPRAGHSVPCAFLLYLAALPLALWWSPLLMPLAAYALLSISISTATAWEHRDPATAPLMPFVFLTIHLAYPAGLIAESLRLLGHHKLGLTEPKRPRQSDSVAKSLRSHPSPTLPRAAASTRFAVSLNRGASTPTSRIRP